MPVPAAVPGSGRFAPTRVDRLISLGIVAAFLAVWELASRAGWISRSAFPPPSVVARALARLWGSELPAHVGATLGRFGSGLLGGGLPGIAAGLCIGWSPRLRRIFDPLIAAAHSVPKLVLFPLLLAIFGVSEVSKLAAISLSVFFPAIINSAAGAREISPLYFEVIRGYGGTRWAVFRHVIVPGSLPMVLTGLRIAANIGLLVTIAIEFTVASPGIGSVIWLSWQTMAMENLYAGVAVLSVIGISINAGVQWSIHRVAPWLRNA